MKERGILFSGEMVRAILEGRKSQTRRVIKTQPEGKFLGLLERSVRGINVLRAWFDEGEITSPFGSVGDVLWVRETFALEHRVKYGQEPPFNDGRPIKYDESTWMQPHYRATDPTPELDYEDGDVPKVKWTPSIHMSRWASRINLEITGVRVERLNEISEKDAWAEGCEGYDDDVTGGLSGYQEFSRLWESINGEGSWAKNPWVWCISFRRI